MGYRKNKEPKVLLGEVKEKDALEFAFAYLTQDGKTVTFEKWKDFVNMASLVRGAKKGLCFFLKKKFCVFFLKDEILKLLLQQKI
jgi:hypothetical protein